MEEKLQKLIPTESRRNIFHTDDEEETKNHIEEMKKGTYNILVAVRCRPLSSKEKEISDIEVVKVLDRKMLVLIDPYEYNGHSEIFKNRSREQNYAFDLVFDKYSSQVS
jgi:kinesin family protein 18/19